jgi:hypothetical protein
MKAFGLGLLFFVASLAWGTSPTSTNYRSVLEMILARADRDYVNLTNGTPTPGGIAMVENLFALYNTMSLNGPGTFDTYVVTNAGPSPCSTAGPQCTHYKGRLRNSTVTSTSTLFDTQTSFAYDLVVWMDLGGGYFRYMEGSLTFSSGNAGQGNLTYVSCPSCSTIGHITLEWNTQTSPWRIREKLYDNKVASNPDAFSQMLFNTTYNPTAGAIQIAMAATNLCDASGNGDSFCNASVPPLNSSAYSALLNGNSQGGYAFVAGTQASNTSSSTPVITTANTVCIQSNGNADTGSPTICNKNSVDNFSGITAFSPSSVTLSWSLALWPLPDESDTPDF